MTNEEIETNAKSLAASEGKTWSSLSGDERIAYANRIRTGEPAVGMGATFGSWTDSFPATVIQILIFKSGPRTGQVRGVVVQHDSAHVVSGSTHDGSAVWECTPNLEGPVDTFLVDARGRYVRKGDRYTRLGLGQRRRYEDPSF